MVGILFATAYIALASTPKNKEIIALSETRITQRDTELGTMGHE